MKPSKPCVPIVIRRSSCSTSSWKPRWPEMINHNQNLANTAPLSLAYQIRSSMTWRGGNPPRTPPSRNPTGASISRSAPAPMRQRRPRMHEGLEIIRKCLNEAEFSFSGTYWKFENVRMTPKPIQRSLPLWVAAMFPKAIEEAGAKGYHLASAPPAPWRLVYDHALRNAGYDPGQFQRAGPHVGHLASTHEKAWDEFEPH